MIRLGLTSSTRNNWSVCEPSLVIKELSPFLPESFKSTMKLLKVVTRVLGSDFKFFPPIIHVYLPEFPINQVMC